MRPAKSWKADGRLSRSLASEIGRKTVRTLILAVVAGDMDESTLADWLRRNSAPR